MFVNLSNHPSVSWSREQLEAAKAYGEVIDLPFPDVSPQMDEQELSLLADDYLQRVRDISPEPCTIHVMGELTFSFVMVSRLLAKGYTCVASTTISYFSFIVLSSLVRNLKNIFFFISSLRNSDIAKNGILA